LLADLIEDTSVVEAVARYRASTLAGVVDCQSLVNSAKVVLVGSIDVTGSEK
jgi:hypothetical protein